MVFPILTLDPAPLSLFPLLQVIKRLFLLGSDSLTALGGSSYSTYFTSLNGKHFGQHDN